MSKADFSLLHVVNHILSFRFIAGRTLFFTVLSYLGILWNTRATY